MLCSTRGVQLLVLPVLQRYTAWFLQRQCVKWCVVLTVVVVVYWYLSSRLNQTIVITSPSSTQQTITDTPTASECTLYNPTKLESVLQTFIGSSPLDSYNRTSERHRSEKLCRVLLEKMLGCELPKVRPRWLMNPTTKRCLELDLYNEEHRLAFEVDGAQHQHYTPHFHGNQYHFEYRKLLDKLKNELCKEAGVRLIRIPWNRGHVDFCVLLYLSYSSH